MSIRKQQLLDLINRHYEYKEQKEEHLRNTFSITKKEQDAVNNKMFFGKINQVSRFGIFPSTVENTIYVNNLILYIQLLPDQVKYKMIELMKFLNIHKYSSNDDFLSILSTISEIANFYGPEFDKDWIYFYGIHQMFEYYPVLPQHAMSKEIKTWLVDEVDLTINGDANKWHDYFTKAIDDIFDLEFQSSQSVLLSLDDYLNGYKWLKGKGTDIRASYIYDKKKKIRRQTKRTKQSASFNVTPSTLKERVLSVTPQILRPFQKPEVGKLRSIISGDFDNFIKMDYVSTFLESGFSNHPHMCIFYNKDYRNNLAVNMLKNGRSMQYMKLPLDQSKFDHMVTRRMLTIIFDKLNKIMPSQFEYKKVMHYLTLSMFSEQSIIDNDGEIFQYVKGIASGWRWTALLDTIVNYAEFLVIQRLYNETCNHKGYKHLTVIEKQFQGDDVRLVLDNDSNDCNYLMELYAACGLKVNKQKNFISRNRDEFLKLVSQNGKLSGYPARVIPSLTQNKPLTTASLNFVDRIRDITQNSFRAVRRGLDMKAVFDYVTFLLNRQDVDIAAYHDWLVTPATFGGYGCRDTKVMSYLGKNQEGNTGLIPTLIEYNNKLDEPGFEKKVFQFKKHIDPDVLNNNIMSMLPYKDRGISIVERSHFKNINKFTRLSQANDTILDIAPRYKPNNVVHPVIYESLKLTAIKKLDLIVLQELLEPQSFSNLNVMRDRGISKSVVSLWLQNKLEIVVPPSIHYDPGMVSMVTKNNQHQFYRHVFARNATINSVTAALYHCELYIYREIIDYINENQMSLMN